MKIKKTRLEKYFYHLFVREKVLTARDHEIITEGGEERFLKNMIDESLEFRKQVGIFTTLIGKKKNLKILMDYLHERKQELLKEEKPCSIKYQSTTFYQGKTLR